MIAVPNDSHAEVNGPAARILVVDDEASQMQALCNTLCDQGYEILGFTTAEAALSALAEAKFDLLLSDLMMPGMDGIALLEAALRVDPDIVGVIMTGEGTISSAVEAMKVGALDYILKPFKLSVILPVLSRALTVRKLRLKNAELEKCLRERAAELEAANTDLEAFTFSVSHDLKSPLRAIGGCSDVLMKQHGAGMSDEAKRLFSYISQGAQRMDLIIDALLKLARLGRRPLHKINVDIRLLVNEVVEELSTQGTRRIDVHVGELPPSVGDFALLKQVFSNLLANAFKFSRDTEHPVVEVGFREQDGDRVYFVRDNGAGFDMRHAGKLFTAFQRMHGESEFEGTGVGLSIVARIVHRHGGRIWAEAEVNKGACFFFTLLEE